MTVRVGIIGAGRMGQEHMRRLSSIPEARIAAVADVDAALAEGGAARHQVRGYGDARAMLDAEALDAVVIATPGRLHREQVELAAGRGLHILLEKPVAIEMGDALAIGEAVARAGVITAVGYQWRNLEFIDEARRVLGDEPVSMVNGLWYWTTPPIAWIADRDRGGGQMVDQATHLLDLIRYLVGDFETVYARYTTRARAGQAGFNNWDAQAVACELEGGAVGVIQASYALFPDVPVPPTLDVVQRDRLLRIMPQQLEVHQPGQTRVFRARGGWGQQLNSDFIQAVASGEREGIRCDVPEAVKSLAVSLAANESAASGHPVTVRSLLG